MSGLDWLTAVPIAHRGLHDRAAGAIENTPTAVQRAIEAGYAIEIDVQPTADGKIVVFHDEALGRLTESAGAVAASTLDELRSVPFRDTTDRIWTLDECLDLVDGRATLVVEIKSSWSDAGPFAANVARTIASRHGPIAMKSFDPRAVRAARKTGGEAPCGIVGEAFADGLYWSHLTATQRFGARNLLHWPWSRPDFLSWNVGDLERGAVRLARAAGVPVMTWTVRSPVDQARAGLFADQMVFEGFRP